ncbi:transcription termination factor NusA, partial [candidate division WOR-3 bacterium]|nr:transcription termination factor NusA [candidate division WOR-3 bacterium]
EYMTVYNISHFLNQLAEDRNIDLSKVQELFEDTIKTIARKTFGRDTDVNVNINESDGSISVIILKEVVKRVELQSKEIALKDAVKYDESVKIGDTLSIPIEFETFGRNAILLTKQLLFQKLREVERDAIYSSFEQRVGEIVTGSIRRIEGKRILISLDKTEGVLQKKEQIQGEYFRQGSIIKTYILSVDLKDGIQLSRTHPDFLRGLFESEVPEIKEGIVEIKDIVRIPGIRAKVAVISNDPRIDPVGACVGVKGSRVQVVVKELAGEKIDVIQWSQDSLVYVSRSLSGVKILKEDRDEDSKRIQIIVGDDELPIAIGKNGQNAFLSSKLTGYRIDIISESMYNKTSIANIKGLASGLKTKLLDSGFISAYDVVFNGLPKLLKIKGIGKNLANKAYEISSEVVKNIKHSSINKS